MKKVILFLMLALFIAGNLTVLAWDGVDPIKSVGFEKTE